MIHTSMWTAGHKLHMLRIEIAKRWDGVGVLSCTREDSSITWQKQARHAAHFALHDLTHYAVETALGYRHAFFGLIADGWEIEETTGQTERGELPAEALEAEKIVGLFDAERASGTLWNVEEFNRFAPRRLTDSEIHSIRSLRAELFSKWAATAPGQKLELIFDTCRCLDFLNAVLVSTVPR